MEQKRARLLFLLIPFYKVIESITHLEKVDCKKMDEKRRHSLRDSVPFNNQRKPNKVT